MQAKHRSISRLLKTSYSKFKVLHPTEAVTIDRGQCWGILVNLSPDPRKVARKRLSGGHGWEMGPDD